LLECEAIERLGVSALDLVGEESEVGGVGEVIGPRDEQSE